jgi:hypothetical protein
VDAVRRRHVDDHPSSRRTLDDGVLARDAAVAEGEMSVARAASQDEAIAIDDHALHAEAKRDGLAERRLLTDEAAGRAT